MELNAIIGRSEHPGDAHALEAQKSLTSAYNFLAGLPGNDYSGTELAGLTLDPGTYKFTSSVKLSNGILYLDAKLNINAEWVFQIGSSLTTAEGAEVRVINGGSPYNVYWQIGSSASIFQDTIFVGNIVALTSISLASNVSLTGRALARNGAVTMVSNLIKSFSCY